MSQEWLDFQTRAQVQKLSIQVEGFLSPVGAIQLWAGASTNAPNGWIVCDGSSVLKTTYPQLFAVIGGAFGSVDVDHFTLPDFRGKFPFGVSPANVIGSSGGSKTITTDNMPNHNHPNTSDPTGIAVSVSTTSLADLPNHDHTYTRPNASNLSGVPIGAPSMNGTSDVSTGGVNGQPIAISITSTSSASISDPSHTHTSGVVGGGADYLQPYVSVFYIICYTSTFPTT